MSDNGDLEQTDPGRSVMPIRANDPPLVVAAYTVWNRMIENHSLDVKRACEETGVPRWQFYEALKSEAVQAEIGRWLEIMRTIEAKLITENWFEIVHHQIEIARGLAGDPRASTQAARFLAGLRQELEERSAAGMKERDDEAMLFLQQFASKPTKSSYKAKRTRKTGPGETISEEFTIERSSDEGEGEGIEG